MRTDIGFTERGMVGVNSGASSIAARISSSSLACSASFSFRGRYSKATPMPRLRAVLRSAILRVYRCSRGDHGKSPQSQARQRHTNARRQRIPASARTGPHVAGGHSACACRRRAWSGHELPRCRLGPRRGDAANGRPRGARGHGHRHRDRRCAGRRGLQDLRREGGAEFEQITADLLKLEEPAGATFDLTYCRLLLMQMRDPVAILEKMAAWTKPGGVVVAQELDFGAITVEPTCP